MSSPEDALAIMMGNLESGTSAVVRKRPRFDPVTESSSRDYKIYTVHDLTALELIFVGTKEAANNIIAERLELGHDLRGFCDPVRSFGNVPNQFFKLVSANERTRAGFYIDEELGTDWEKVTILPQTSSAWYIWMMNPHGRREKIGG